MAREVEHAIDELAVLLVEAGPGTGKSLAYLIPALSGGRRPVAVSTYTINLQNQLMEKDIPTAEAVIGRRFKTALLKGKNNYLCRRKADDIGKNGLEATLFNRNEIKKNLTVYSRIIECGRGDREEIPVAVPAALWQELACDSETCTRGKCPWFSRCYYFDMRRKASDAELVVTNHALFFSEMLTRFDELDYQAVIFDEAHHVLQAATDCFTIRLHQSRFRRMLYYLSRQLLKGGKKPVPDKLFSLNSLVRDTDKHASSLFSALCSEQQYRKDLTCAELSSAGISRVFDGIEEIRRKVADYAESGELTLDNPEFPEYLAELAEHTAAFLDFDSSQYIFYREGGSGQPELRAARPEIADLLRDTLFSRQSAFIFTSATLGVNGDFSYFRSSVGLPESARGVTLDSPFDFEKQSILFVTPGLPDVDHADFLSKAGIVLEDLLAVTSGRAFILFTSFQMLDRFWCYLSEPLRVQGYFPLRQGQQSRSSLLSDFRSKPKPVLFATASFWEGVDIPGSDLSLVIIMRLPFSSPDDPLLQRKSQLLKEQGGNPFSELSLPEAILRLKQGLGRLIRTAGDHGVLAILDNRFLNKWYGKKIQQALPKMRITNSIDTVKAFYHGKTT
ncbi:MAG: helicase C-terminal domain-containing protein [Candidatus Wallbacteria bacterium]|nr:helicase C-terminal domain-containing protein [Candidatus Wallbacteria bacterium]